MLMLVSLLVALPLAAIVGCAGGVTPTIAVALALAQPSIAVGETTTATATVTEDGTASPGQTVTFSSSNTAVATVSPATDATDAAGRAQVTVNAVGAGTTTITATANGVSDTADLTVASAPVARVAFWNITDAQFQVAENAPGASPENLDLGGIYFLFGAQRNGSLVFLTEAGYANPQVRDLATGVSTDFSPAVFSMWNGGIGVRLAAITSDGQQVVWIRSMGATREIVRANIDGSDAVVLVSSAVPALSPARVAISPNDSEVAYITAADSVRRVSMAGGASVLLNLNGSTGATALDWRDDNTLVVACANALGTGTHGLITLPRDVSPASILFNDGGVGLRSTPVGVAVDPDGNILFDELDVSLTQHEIYRVDPPGLGGRIGIVTRPENDVAVWSLVY